MDNLLQLCDFFRSQHSKKTSYFEALRLLHTLDLEWVSKYYYSRASNKINHQIFPSIPLQDSRIVTGTEPRDQSREAEVKLMLEVCGSVMKSLHHTQSLWKSHQPKSPSPPQFWMRIGGAGAAAHVDTMFKMYICSKRYIQTIYCNKLIVIIMVKTSETIIL